MIRVIICDDNKSILDLYSTMLGDTAKAAKIDAKIICMESGEQLLFNLSDEPNSVDIIYLDILMARMNGIETARKLREIGCMAELIFLTSSSEYVFQGFDSNPFYYIVKDEMPTKKFKDIFLRAVASARLRAERFITISFGGNTMKLALDKIRYFEVQNRLVTVHTLDNDISYYSTLEEIEGMLGGKGFVRIHRSYLVNCYYIQRLTRTQVFLAQGTELPVSAKYAGSVQKMFSDYLIEV
jgi:two-component system response regulator LytT